jgi:hypothetical protein
VSKFKIPLIRYVEDNSLGSLEIEKINPSESSYSIHTVITSTLDQFMKNQKLEKLTLIKIDVEGHEMAVIEGAMETINKLKPKMIVEIETRHHPTISLNELIKSISNLGYYVSYFDCTKNILREYDSAQPIEQSIHDWGTRKYINNYIFIADYKDHEEFIQNVNSQLAKH